jgi:dihydroflavonol-4-reductase
MSKAFVTGATGFIGAHVASALQRRGWSIKALKRLHARPMVAQSKEIEWVTGDLRSFESMHSAIAGCEVVFHVAADYRLWAKDPREIYASNVDGTVNVLKAAQKHGVDRVVYTSSVGALGLHPDGSPADETVPVSLNEMVGHYKRSKFLAEREVEKFVQQGLPVVLVHPSTPVGPGDHKPTPTGKIIVDYLNGRMPAFLDTGLNLVHVRDVAEGHWLALERGRVGEKYILGKENLTLAEIFALLEQISGIPAPRIRLPHWPILILAHLLDPFSRLTGKEPLIPLEGVKMAHRKMFFDAGKAVRELGMPQTSVEVALTEAARWFYEQGYALNQNRN